MSGTGAASWGVGYRSGPWRGQFDYKIVPLLKRYVTPGAPFGPRPFPFPEGRNRVARRVIKRSGPSTGDVSMAHWALEHPHHPDLLVAQVQAALAA